MTWKDKLEIGLKPDAPIRKDNLPKEQVRGPQIDAGKGRSAVIPAAAGDKTVAPPARRQARVRNDAEIGEDSSEDVDKDDVWVPPDQERQGGKKR